METINIIVIALVVGVMVFLMLYMVAAGTSKMAAVDYDTKASKSLNELINLRRQLRMSDGKAKYWKDIAISQTHVIKDLTNINDNLSAGLRGCDVTAKAQKDLLDYQAGLLTEAFSMLKASKTNKESK